jgi:hypothetical protein
MKQQVAWEDPAKAGTNKVLKVVSHHLCSTLTASTFFGVQQKRLLLSSIQSIYFELRPDKNNPSSLCLYSSAVGGAAKLVHATGLLQTLIANMVAVSDLVVSSSLYSHSISAATGTDA